MTTQIPPDDERPTQRTPGEWAAVKNQHNEASWLFETAYTRAQGLPVEPYAPQPAYYTIEARGITVARTMVGFDEATADANARLIAAAPDLLAACKDLLRFAESVRPGGRVLESDADLESARAAIARAEGGAA